VKDRFKADDEEPGGGGGSHRPEKRPSVLPSWSEGLKASRGGDDRPKEDVVLSPPDDALLKELEAPSVPEGGDWLEDAVNVPPSTDAVDDLDVVIVSNPEGSADPAEVTHVFHRPEDDLFGPNGAEALPDMGGGRKPTLPGLPSTPSKGRAQQKSLPPPLPEPSRPGRKH
jgi:hypothetical protein